MKEEGLLKLENRINRSGSGRKFVKFRKVYTSRPLQCLEMDIKMVWVPNVGKNAYLLSIIDVHTRRILKDYFSFNILTSYMFFRYPSPITCFLCYKPFSIASQTFFNCIA